MHEGVDPPPARRVTDGGVAGGLRNVDLIMALTFLQTRFAGAAGVGLLALNRRLT